MHGKHHRPFPMETPNTIHANIHHGIFATYGHPSGQNRIK